MPVDPEKLAKLQKSSAKKVGGSRVKAKKNIKTEQDDTKLIEALGKLKATKIEGVEEANFFREDGKVLHSTELVFKVLQLLILLPSLVTHKKRILLN